MQLVRIRTAQNVDIEYEVASIGDRIVAAVLDMVIVLLYVLAIVLLWVFVATTFEPTFSEGFGVVPIIVSLVVPTMFYHLIFEVFNNGQSLGKKIRKIRVVKIDGSQPSIGSYILRWLIRLIEVDLMSGAVAVVAILISGKGQRLGDMAAKTTVIRLIGHNLDGTIFTPIEAGYEPVFPQVSQLTGQDVSTIKEVLNVSTDRKTYSKETQQELLDKTKSSIQNRLDVQSDLPPQDFLSTVLKDYNAVKWKRSTIGSGSFRHL